jgi:hypothetical protein
MVEPGPAVPPERPDAEGIEGVLLRRLLSVATLDPAARLRSASPGGVGGEDGGHERMVGERHVVFTRHPGGQVIGGSQRRPVGVIVAVGSGLFGQVRAGAHAHR